MDSEKKHEDEWVSPFTALDKGTVLMETRMFSDTHVEPRKACQILTKVLYLLHTGESLTTTEATNTFFGVTKLFQSNDPALRRMTYLAIKELAAFAEDTIIITSSLQKDMTSGDSPKGIFRAHAIRALCAVTDASLLGQVERYLKQAVVDKVPIVASAALSSGIHLFLQNPDFVRRWSSEITEAAKTKGSAMVPYHALGLLFEIKKHDRLALRKLVSDFSNSNSLRSPYAWCTLLRWSARLLQEPEKHNIDHDMRRSMLQFIEAGLRHRKEMVVFEAAKALIAIPSITAQEAKPAISVLQLFLSAPKALHRFAAVRALTEFAKTKPDVVARCNMDLENIITDTNRNVGTLAITCLLKTGTEANVDRLVKQIGGFMAEIADENKIVVAESLHQLCVKYPAKHRDILAFLSTLLRDEGGFDFKRTVVSVILSLMIEIPTSTELCMSHLAEFIEDCEYPLLISKVLHVLGKYGPKSERPAKYVRFIYNRLILETAPVRAAAVSALAEYGLKVESLKGSVNELLGRCVNDDDDEVRDRAAYSLAMLNDSAAYLEAEKGKKGEGEGEAAESFNLNAIALAARMYLQHPSSEPFGPADIATATTQLAAEAARSQLERAQPYAGSGSKGQGRGDGIGAGVGAIAGMGAVSYGNGIPSTVIPKGPPKPEIDAAYMAQYKHYLSTVPKLNELGVGAHHKSSQPVSLTEKGVEVEVECVKHVFSEHLVVQFNVASTLNDKQLNVTVKLDMGQEIDGEVSYIEATIPPNGCAPAFAIMKRDADIYPIGSFDATLYCEIYDVDESGEVDMDMGGDLEEYEINSVDITYADYMLRTFITDFTDQWRELSDENEMTETYALGASVQTLPQAVKAVADFLGMKACDKTNVVKVNSVVHSLLLSGLFVTGDIVLCSCALRLNKKEASVEIVLSVRCENEHVREEIVNSIA